METSKTYGIVSGVAITVLGYQILRKVLEWLYMNVIGPKLLGPRVDFARQGKWAVITGATDGIGKAYAKELARRGMSLVLISRSQEKLKSVAKEIEEKSGVEIKIIDVDFTHGVEIYQKIRQNIQGLDIGVLVNNVGISYKHPDFFLDVVERDPKFLQDIIAANIHSVTHMCALVMPGMVAKKKGVVINLSSTAAVIPNPLLTIYSATKAFVDKFSVDLQTEYQDKGIIVQSVQPGFVATNMTGIRKPNMFAPSADTYVRSALKTVGIAGQTAGYVPHAILQLGLNAIATVTCNPFARKVVFNNLSQTRKRALRKLNKKE